MADITAVPLIRSAVTKCGDVRKKNAVFTAVMSVAAFAVVASFIAFIVLMSVRGGGRREIHFFWNFIPFACFAAGAFVMPFAMAKKNFYRQLCAVADRIECADSTVIASLAADLSPAAEDAARITVGAIIAGGALPDYEIVADKVVAKKSLTLSDKKAEEMYGEFVARANSVAAVSVAVRAEEKVPTHCPSCGAPVVRDGAKFCESCGVRLPGGGAE